ncbi:unnamed protein product, partial [Heterotrigona itama]
CINILNISTYNKWNNKIRNDAIPHPNTHTHMRKIR